MVSRRPSALSPGQYAFAADSQVWLIYVVGALQKVKSGLGAHALNLLQLPQPPIIESVLTTLINELNAIDVDLALIIDDYHSVENQSVHDGVAFLLDHLPPVVHIVLAGRAEPRLPLADNPVLDHLRRRLQEAP